MKRGRTYLDYNASAPLTDAARDAMLSALDLTANASSVHGDGRRARRLIETARRDVAALVGADAANVVFTSGATEAASWLLRPEWRMGRAPVVVDELLVCASDHPATLRGGSMPAERVRILDVDQDGLLRMDALEAALAEPVRAGMRLLAMHLANNETGVIQPFREIGRLAKAHGAVVVFDAVQAAGRLKLDLGEGWADFLILSSHKIGGPQGAGALVSAGGVLMPAPLHVGGGQERGHRAGTENVAAIAGFGAAASQAVRALERMDEVAALRERFEAEIANLVPDAVFFGRRAPRLANTCLFAIPGMKAETAQIAFDLAGISLSAGSACSSGRVGPSHVLEAMRVSEASGALRVSFGVATGDAELAAFVGALSEIAGRRANARAA